MKKIVKLVLMTIVVLCAASCTSIQQTAPVMGIAGNNITTNIKADIDYSSAKKIQGEATTNRVLWIFKHTPGGNTSLKTSNRYKGLNGAEKLALYRAKKSGNSDIVLEPQFESVTKSYFFGIFKKTKVKATGWGVDIKGFSENPTFTNSVEKFSNDVLF